MNAYNGRFRSSDPRLSALLAVSPTHLPRLLELFTKIDNDGSGRIDMHEFYSYFAVCEDPFVNNLFLSIDQRNDGTGSLSFRDFVELVALFTALTREDILRFTFQ